jgi:hypothetical protein
VEEWEQVMGVGSHMMQLRGAIFVIDLNTTVSASHARLFGACGCVSGREGPVTNERTNMCNRSARHSAFRLLVCRLKS